MPDYKIISMGDNSSELDTIYNSSSPVANIKTNKITSTGVAITEQSTLEKVKYLDDDINKGIVVDWALVRKYYKKLGCPKNVYNPNTLPYQSSTYFILQSERATGKTTGLLLTGMILNRLYGIEIQYLRSKESMIANKVIQDLFSVIREFHYVDKLTHGEYNDVEYRARRWYYVYRDEEGNITKKSAYSFMTCLAIDKSELYKSTYNAPTGDFIIFDEFVGKYYPTNEFVYFADLLSTIIRKRRTAKIFMLANTIDKHSPYYSELEIYDDVQIMEVGTNKQVKTDLGTDIYLEFIGLQMTEAKREYNKLYFGFKSPNLAAITGGGWSTNNYRHIKPNYTVVKRGCYIEFNNKYLALDLVKYPENNGVFIAVHKATGVYDDSLIYTLDELKDKRYRYWLGNGKDNISKFYIKLIEQHKIMFQDNSVGSMFSHHLFRGKPPKEL